MQLAAPLQLRERRSDRARHGSLDPIPSHPSHPDAFSLQVDLGILASCGWHLAADILRLVRDDRTTHGAKPNQRHLEVALAKAFFRRTFCPGANTFIEPFAKLHHSDTDVPTSACRSQRNDMLCGMPASTRGLGRSRPATRSPRSSSQALQLRQRTLAEAALEPEGPVLFFRHNRLLFTRSSHLDRRSVHGSVGCVVGRVTRLVSLPSVGWRLHLLEHHPSSP